MGLQLPGNVCFGDVFLKGYFLAAQNDDPSATKISCRTRRLVASLCPERAQLEILASACRVSGGTETDNLRSWTHWSPSIPLLQDGRFPEFQLFSFSRGSGQFFGQPLNLHVAVSSNASQGFVS